MELPNEALAVKVQSNQKNNGLDFETYRVCCNIVAMHEGNRKRYLQQIEDMCQLKQHADSFIQGGENTSSAEIAAFQVEKFNKTSPLAAMYLAVEKALNTIRFQYNGANDGYGDRLARALQESCKNVHHGNFEYLNRHYRLYLSRPTFCRMKKRFIIEIAEMLGLK